MGQLDSPATIASRALNLVGENSITSLSDAGAQATTANLHFGPARDTILEQMRPNFAKKFYTLAAASPGPTLEWAYEFPLPPDYIAISKTIPGDTLYQVIGDSIYTDDAKLSIIYIYRATDTTKWTPLFTDAVVYMLASRLAPVFKSDFGIAEKFEAAAGAMIKLAATRESQEDSAVDIGNDDLILVRSING